VSWRTLAHQPEISSQRGSHQSSGVATWPRSIAIGSRSTRQSSPDRSIASAVVVGGWSRTAPRPCQGTSRTENIESLAVIPAGMFASLFGALAGCESRSPTQRTPQGCEHGRGRPGTPALDQSPHIARKSCGRAGAQLLALGNGELLAALCEELPQRAVPRSPAGPGGFQVLLGLVELVYSQLVDSLVDCVEPGGRFLARLPCRWRPLRRKLAADELSYGSSSHAPSSPPKPSTAARAWSSRAPGRPLSGVGSPSTTRALARRRRRAALLRCPHECIRPVYMVRTAGHVAGVHVTRTVTRVGRNPTAEPPPLRTASDALRGYRRRRPPAMLGSLQGVVLHVVSSRVSAGRNGLRGPEGR